MADQEEKTKQETVYVPQSIVDIIDQFAEHGIIATKKGAIYRHLIIEGVQQAIRDGLVEKTLNARQMLTVATLAKNDSNKK